MTNSSVVEFILEKEIEKEYGARSIRRIIKKYVEDMIVENVLEEKIFKEDEYELKIEGCKCVVVNVIM